MTQGRSVIILAAGLGTRMRSQRAKVLHAVLGRPLLFWSLQLARSLDAERIVVVLGHQRDEVSAAAEARFGQQAFRVAHQDEPRGTGHAVQQALATLDDAGDESEVVILYGDVPLIQKYTIDGLSHARGQGPLALVATELGDPTGYGRLLRADGRLVRIVEEKDADESTRRIQEVNAGIYAVRMEFLRRGVAALSANNAAGEFLLTDLVLSASQDAAVPTVTAPFEEVAGINDRVDLAAAEGRARRRACERWMRAGVTLLAPDSVVIEEDIEGIGADTEIGQGVELRGDTWVGAGVRIDTGARLTDCRVEDGAHIKAYSVLARTRVGPRAQVGPFAHCRPGTSLGERVKVGNFVETKNARLGDGVKASHLSYLGDVEIGADANIGAGTITCNYDGAHKHVTVIEEGAFIGSDTQLVAPVTVGKNAYVGAGSTITRDVPAEALAVSRAEQRHIKGYAAKKKSQKP